MRNLEKELNRIFNKLAYPHGRDKRVKRCYICGASTSNLKNHIKYGH